MKPIETTSTVGALSRVFWMLIGPMGLYASAAAILTAGPGWLTAADLSFLCVLGAMILARCLEFRGGNPRTSTGEPATAAHLRRYVATVFVVGLTVWLVVNLVANFGLTA